MPFRLGIEVHCDKAVQGRFNSSLPAFPIKIVWIVWTCTIAIITTEICFSMYTHAVFQQKSMGPLCLQALKSKVILLKAKLFLTNNVLLCIMYSFWLSYSVSVVSGPSSRHPTGEIVIPKPIAICHYSLGGGGRTKQRVQFHLELGSVFLRVYFVWMQEMCLLYLQLPVPIIKYQCKEIVSVERASRFNSF